MAFVNETPLINMNETPETHWQTLSNDEKHVYLGYHGDLERAKQTAWEVREHEGESNEQQNGG